MTKRAIGVLVQFVVVQRFFNESVNINDRCTADVAALLGIPHPRHAVKQADINVSLIKREGFREVVERLGQLALGFSYRYRFDLCPFLSSSLLSRVLSLVQTLRRDVNRELEPRLIAQAPVGRLLVGSRYSSTLFGVVHGPVKVIKAMKPDLVTTLDHIPD